MIHASDAGTTIGVNTAVLKIPVPFLQKKISNAIISDNTISNRKSKEANTAVFFIDTRKSGSENSDT